MAFAEPFDPTTPTDSDLVSNGDDSIRQLKRALSERLVTAFSNWPDGDPLELTDALTGASVQRGLDVDRPNPPTSDFYFATDVSRMYIADALHAGWLGTVSSSETVNKVATYYGTNAAGSRVAGYADAAKIVHLLITGTLDGSGNISVDLDEFTPPLDVSKVVSFLAFGPGTTSLPSVKIATSYVADTPTNSLIITVRNINDGTPVTGATVFSALIVLSA